MKNLRRHVIVKTMKTLAALFLMVCLFSPNLYSAPRSFGLGLVLGSPTAITGKYWLDSTHAIDMGLGYWFGDYVDIYGDYLWHFPRAFSTARHPISEIIPYIGVGGDLHVANHPPPNPDNNHPNVGVFGRIPFGLEWLPSSAPLGVFLEVVPYVQLIPGLGVWIGAGIGARFYF